ncbi:hypothetical protein B0G38_000097 [Arthrobacter sp. VKM Ac-2550]|nr:hypothetical protein [Arthrobacter sp. VKM Ac-2550]
MCTSDNSSTQRGNGNSQIAAAVACETAELDVTHESARTSSARDSGTERGTLTPLLGLSSWLFLSCFTDMPAFTPSCQRNDVAAR